MEDLNKKFGLKVKKYRKEVGISQEELAGRSGLHRTYISGIELGKRNVSLNNIGKISESLGVPIWKFFLFEEKG